MNLSIIIVTFKRQNLLKNCLESIFQQQKNSFNLQIIVVINGHDPETDNLLQKLPFNFNIIKKPKGSPGDARNQGIKKVQSPYILFLDDDVILPLFYFQKAEKIIRQGPDIDVFGGPDQNYPQATLRQKALSLALSSPIVMGPTYKRHTLIKNQSKIKATEKSLILCHLWFKSRIFLTEGFKFNHYFFRNEENELLNLLQKKKKNIFYFSEIFVYHKRKEKFIELFKTLVTSAYFRRKQLLQNFKWRDLIYLGPTFLLLYPLGYFFIPEKISEYYLYPIYLYFLFMIFFAIKKSYQQSSQTLFIWVMIYQFYILICYGLGHLIFVSPKRWYRHSK